MTIGMVWLAANAAFSSKFRTKSNYHVDLRTNHFRHRSERLGCSLVDPSVFNDEIPALGESELAQFSKKPGITHRKKWIVGSGPNESDTMDLSGLLRVRCNRTHGRRATKQRDEISSLHEPS
jgi:hypothetical protein